MRCLRKPDVLEHLPEQWENLAKEALEELKKIADPDDRSAFIDAFFTKNAAVWTKVKEALAKPSFGKCWYSEAKRALSELEIEHFRPKRRVWDAANHRGYWWLAFEWDNLRLASQIANKRRHDPRAERSLGKGCYFPLLNEPDRVPDHPAAAVTGEKPVLLDPYLIAEVLLLDYSPSDGKVVAKFAKTADVTKHRRAHDSIELYHLNEGTLIADRAQLGIVIGQKSKRIEEIYALKQAGGVLTDDHHTELDQLQGEIAQLISANAEFSAFARACLMQQGDRGWNLELLKAA